MKFWKFLNENCSIIVLAMLLRLAFAPFTGHPYDLPIWMQSGELLAKGISPYSPYHHLGQTILWALWTGLSFTISNLIPFGRPWIYIFLIKLLPIAADIACAYLILNIIEEESGAIKPSHYRFYVITILFNPVMIFASAFWAMTDSISLAMILMAYRCIKIEKWIPSALFLSISIALKLYPVILLPPFLLYILFYQKSYLKAIGFGLTTALSFLMIAYLPFLILPWPATEISGVLTSQTARVFGGVSILGLLTVAVESTYIGEAVDPLNSELIKVIWIRFLWLFNSVIATTLIFLAYLKRKFIPSEDRFMMFWSLTIFYYILWVLCATWVSEQNILPLLLLTQMISIYQRESGEQSDASSAFYLFETMVIAAHIIINVPLILFFHLLDPSFFLIYNNNSFMEVRTLSLFALIIASTLNLGKLFIDRIRWLFFEGQTYEDVRGN